MVATSRRGRVESFAVSRKASGPTEVPCSHRTESSFEDPAIGRLFRSGVRSGRGGAGSGPGPSVPWHAGIMAVGAGSHPRPQRTIRLRSGQSVRRPVQP